MSYTTPHDASVVTVPILLLLALGSQWELEFWVLNQSSFDYNAQNLVCK